MIDVRIRVDGRSIAGKLLTPEAAAPGPRAAILFVHGWGASQRQDLGKAKWLVRRGHTCLTFNLRGHARTRHQVETVTRAQNLRDVLAAYDRLLEQDSVDAARAGIVGSSYGAYLAVLLTRERKVGWLALQAPALYKDTDFERPKRELNLDATLAAYRMSTLSPHENRALGAAARFAGDVLVVESEQDQVIPRPVIENYLRAFAGTARSLTHRRLAGADHGLTQAGARTRYRDILTDWLRGTVDAGSNG